MVKISLKINVKRMAILSICILLILYSRSVFSSEDDTAYNYRRLNLTYEEIEYLKGINQITYYTNVDFKPVEFVDSDNNPKGIGPEYIKKISNLIGIKCIVKNDNTSINLKEKYFKVSSGEADIISSVVYDHKLADELIFSDTYYKEDVLIIGREDADPIVSNTDFYGKSFLIPSFSWQERYLSSLGTELLINEKDRMSICLDSINRGDDTYTLIEDSSYIYYLKENGYKNIYKKGDLNIKAEYRFAFSKDNKIIRDIFNKAIIYIPREEMYKEALYSQEKKDKTYLYFSIIFFVLLLIVTTYLVYRLYRSYQYRRRLRENKEALIENLSHDLKTPLSNLKVNFGLLKRGLIEENEIEGYYGKLDRNIDNLNNIINDLYGVNEIKDNYNPEANKRVNIDHFLSAIYFEHNSMMLQEKRNFKYISNEHEVYSKISEADLWRAINNILSNSLKYTVENDDIIISLNKDRKMAILSIYDSGCGIPKGELENIFHRFYQIKNNNLKPGKGLGLSISREIIKAHGGKITANSREGVYTEFVIRLPIVK